MIHAVLDTFPGAFENLPEDVQSIPSRVLRDDPALNDKVCRLAVELNGAYYKEGNYPYEDVHDGFMRSMEALYEENDIPVRPILRKGCFMKISTGTA